MTYSDEATLLDAEDDSAGPVFFFVTNRYNLLEFLSSGYVLPAVGIPKYYADLLAYAPGRVPLVRGPVGESIAAEVSREDPMAFPVALELAPSVASLISAPHLRRDGSSSSGKPDDEVVALAPAGLLTLSAVVRIHFRTQDELEEHRAREYENVRTENVELEASPRLFSGEAIGADRLKEFLEALEPVDAVTADFLDGLDRLNGARAMLVAAAAPRVDTLRAVAALLAGKAPNGDEVPSWVHSAVLDQPPQTTTAGRRLFAAATEILRQEDRAAAWRPLEVLGRIEDSLSSTKMSKKDEGEISRNLRPIGAILRNERDFKPFGPDSGLASAKALLLALLRPDPVRLLGWDRRETGADDSVLLGAAVLVGLLRGHKKLPLDKRSVGLDRLLAELAARATARLVPDAVPSSSGGKQLTVDEHAADDGAAVVMLLWGDEVVVEKMRGAPSAVDRLLSSNLAAPAVRDVALLTCRELGWHDCVTTTFAGPGGNFAVDAKTRSVSITIPGLVDPVHSLNEEAFRRRLESEGLPPDLEATVRAQLDS
jgi:hypothetical protein